MTLDFNVQGIPKCLWAKAVDTDRINENEGKPNVTFSKNAKCYSCNGFDTECEQYLKHNYMEDMK